MSDVSDRLDAYIDNAAAVLRLTIEPEWKASVRANLAVSLQMARKVEDFALPDEAEPAPIFAA